MPRETPIASAEPPSVPSDERRRAPSRRLWPALAVALCALLLASIAGFYHPGLGFTSLLIIPEGHDNEIPALRRLPHYEYPRGTAYDGALYVQLAMDPLLRDPAIDRALDAPAYRARRILFCWTAYALGLGNPAWILQAYALQNVLFWLALAWLLARWLPPETPRLLALWAASMFSHGLLMSIRMALLDGPSLFLLALAVAASERGRTWLTASVLAISGLGRETNLLGAVVLPLPRGWRDWTRGLGAAVLIVIPLLVWQDYIWSIYRGSSASAGMHQVTIPFVAYFEKWSLAMRDIRSDGFASPAGYTLLVVVALTVQAVFIAWIRAYRDPWWRLAAAFAVLMLLVNAAVWEGYPGAVTRVTLPLKFGFNVILARRSPPYFWAWFVLGNLDVVAGQFAIPLPGVASLID